VGGEVKSYSDLLRENESLRKEVLTSKNTMEVEVDQLQRYVVVEVVVVGGGVVVVVVVVVVE